MNIYTLTYITPLLLGLGFILGIIHYKNQDRSARLLNVYLLFCLGLDLASRIIGHSTLNNLILFNVLSLIEIVIFSLFFLNLIKKNIFTYLLLSIGVLYIGFETLKINPYQVESFQSYSRIVTSFLIIIMALKYIIESVKKEQKISKKNIIFILMFYFSIELILLLPLNLLINSESDLIYYFWFVRLFINLLFYTYTIYYIWKNGKTPKQ